MQSFWEFYPIHKNVFLFFFGGTLNDKDSNHYQDHYLIFGKISSFPPPPEILNPSPSRQLLKALTLQPYVTWTSGILETYSNKTQLMSAYPDKENTNQGIEAQTLSHKYVKKFNDRIEPSNSYLQSSGLFEEEEGFCRLAD